MSSLPVLGVFAAGTILSLALFSFNEERPVSTPTATINSDAGDGKFSTAGFDLTRWTKSQIDERCKGLTEEQIRITQASGTERPFCGTLLDNKKDGMYCCVVCRLPLFESTSKFTSGTGWPSFYRGFAPRHIAEIEDSSHGMVRTEIRCERCDAHAAELCCGLCTRAAAAGSRGRTQRRASGKAGLGASSQQRIAQPPPP